MNSNILVTGANGQLGSEIKELSQNYKYNIFFTDVKLLDISNKKAIEDFIKQNSIDTIINCAAYTAVDKAEEEKELADKINHIAVKNLAEVSKEFDISLVHISTDYVFNGLSYRPYKESDKTEPQSVYGSTKLMGEEAMIDISPKNSIIIRTSWLYSTFGANFVKTMLIVGRERESLNVIFDQIGTPTYAKDLADTILNILPKLNNKDVEIYHYSNEGVCSWFDFAKAIFELEGMDIKVNPILSEAYPTPAKRPYYSVLDKSKIKKNFDIEISYWKNSLIDCLKGLN